MTREEIQAATAHFEKLLTDQAHRAEHMTSDIHVKKDGPLVVGLCGGDGIGPIIMEQARRALNYLLRDEIKAEKVCLRDIPGLTIENRLALNQAVPDEALTAIKACDALLKGPTTTPAGGTMESANVTLRRALDLYANVRPVQVEAEGIDWTFFRENTEGEYALGSQGIHIPGVLAMDFKVITNAGTRRIAKAAYEFARKNGKTRMAVVTKANIMKKTDGLFSEICHEVAAEYPEIQTDEYYIDIMTANLINPAIRADFQVFLLPNLYGDILTDEAAQIQGGVGTAGSANLGENHAMFEAIHGSAPRLIAQGLGDYANPESILRAACMLLRHVGLPDQAGKLECAITAAGQTARVTGDTDGATCAQFGDAVMAELARD